MHRSGGWRSEVEVPAGLVPEGASSPRHGPGAAGAPWLVDTPCGHITAVSAASFPWPSPCVPHLLLYLITKDAGHGVRSHPKCGTISPRHLELGL